jgi:prephenate dehydrogenase
MAHRTEWNLINAIENADLVVVALPLEAKGLPATLKLIGPHLHAGCVVISFAPLMQAPLQWATAHLPAERYFVAAHPLLSPAHLYDGASGLDAAHADLFSGAVWALAPAPGCAPEALKLASDLALLVKATPYYVDPAEYDGLMGGAQALPALLSAALMRAAVQSTGWSEIRKVADRAFATATLSLDELDIATLTLNRENALRYLDSAIAELQNLRADLAHPDALLLAERLREASERRAQWLAERRRGDWEAPNTVKVELPSASESIQRHFVGNWFSRKAEKK